MRPLLNSPIVQVVISFVVGYYATTKISKVYALIRESTNQRRSKLECQTQLTVGQASSSVLAMVELPQAPESLRLTHKQLREFDGVRDTGHIYTALNGNIYDLTASRDTFMQPGLHSLLAGCNANEVLNIACSSMGVSASDVIQRWERSFNAEFNIIGYLVESDASETDEYRNDDATLE
ncbi:GH25021 [Drosophila grimshawi]|uniref:GH25021 n=2 Tax=Drosophila grimshawi TaxID=7222 RepID=B4JZ88_DROGR|nr:GH25021 [Drosophila grimshawi]